jgi:hypothetical protein
MYARSIRPSSRTTRLVVVARWGPGLRVEAPDDAGPSQRCADDQNWPRTSRLLPILLPEAGDSWAVEAEQDLGPGVELRRFEP